MRIALTPFYPQKNGNVRFDLIKYFSVATKNEIHQNDISRDESLETLFNEELTVSRGVLNNTFGSYARA